MPFSATITLLSKRSSLFLLCLFFSVQLVSAQSPYQFERGLVIGNVYHYGREAIYTDDLAWQLYNGQLKSPVAEGDFGPDKKGASRRWKVSIADGKRQFNNRPFVNGYLYLNYNAEKEQSALLNIKGNSALFFNGVLHTGDPYGLGWMYIPVKLKKGLNEFYVRGQNIVASLSFSPKPVRLNTEDATLPNAVLGKDNTGLLGAVVVMNTTNQVLKNLSLQSLAVGRKSVAVIPDILPMTTRKVIFKVDASGMTAKDNYQVELALTQAGNRLIRLC
jgi:hypothetical protein